MALSTLGKIVRVIKALRGILVALVLFVVAVPAISYVVLSSEWAQEKLCSIANDELSAVLGAKVDIGAVKFSPFNKLCLADVKVHDDNDSVALTVKAIDTRFELMDFVNSGKIIIDYADIDRMALNLYKQDKQSPLNIAGIINHLKKDDAQKKETIFSLRINDVTLSRCSIRYNIWSEPETPERFNPSHLSIDSIYLSVFAPVISNDTYKIWLRNLSAHEKSGLTLSNLSTRIALDKDSLSISALSVRLQNSLLNFADINSSIRALQSLSQKGSKHMLNVHVTDNSHIYLPDLKPFLPILADAEYDLNIEADIKGNINEIAIDTLRLVETNDMLTFDLRGKINDFTDPATIYFDGIQFEAATDRSAINAILSHPASKLTVRTAETLKSLGSTIITGKSDGSTEKGQASLNIRSGLGAVSVNAGYHRTAEKRITRFTVNADIDSLLLGLILPDKGLGSISGILNADGATDGKTFTGKASAMIDRLHYKSYGYQDISLNAEISRQSILANLNVNDPNAKLQAEAEYEPDSDERRLSADLQIQYLRPDTLHLIEKFPGYAAKGDISIFAEGKDIDRFIADANIDNFLFSDGKSPTLRLDRFNINADNIHSKGRITVTSDYINGSIDGKYKFSTISGAIRNIIADIVPAVAHTDSIAASRTMSNDDNNFAFDFSLTNTDRLSEFFNIPVSVIDGATIYGTFNEGEGKAFLKFDAPWVQQGSNIIENTALVLDIKSRDKEGLLYLTSLIPTKKGDMDVVATIEANDGILHTIVDWSLARAIPINGKIDFATSFVRNDEVGLLTRIDFNPGEINFGDEIWAIRPSSILYGKNLLNVRDFALDTGIQSIHIDGAAGINEIDEILVELNNIELINIFETLEIDKALISGLATGRISVSRLFSKDPIIKCDNLTVKSIGYNYCTLGDALVRLSLDDGGTMFNFDADVADPTDRYSRIYGYIALPTESLDLNIEADHVKVGFMKPFMEAFTSNVSGYVSGKAHLYGTFKNIDLEGDVYADDLKIKIDFTNTWYSASDSIHIRPGIINLKNITLKDENGHTAQLNGWVKHKYFHNASFDFDISHASNFLCYDVDEKLNPDWYGTIYGNGAASIKGEPGVVNIGARMTTTNNSIFTFVLSDRLDADEYQFITFRDVTPLPPVPDSLLVKNLIPDKVRWAKAKQGNIAEDTPTAYNMDISVDVTPEAQLMIVMDPVGGDRIKANGSGNLRMTYGSVDNDMRLFGTYTLDKGNYNFTLQDIIIKDFTIKPGSSIYFPGDPYKAKLNLEAYYQVNANLSDLDETFLQDKELNRTNVPVRALMKVTGEMTQPEIDFDLEFPSLSQDVYRKVRSIVSTEDMMNRQIIYLLALNRFYTPEYMASTTKGNELFSVASSTLSSQLSSMLGKLSENWSIAPNLRSDRGDFSDLEVDLTLSSSLLNNRLLFNGNFGYRDKSLNTNQFVGDFDVEYLLNRTGEWRLKAYNRYNDQNYYLRTAQTTQGIGILYRKDFDSTLRFLQKLWRKRKNKKETEPVDTVKIHEHISASDSTFTETEQIIITQ